MSYHVYINIAGEAKLSIYTMDPQSGQLELQEDVALAGGPGPLSLDPGRQFMFIGLRSNSRLGSYRIDRSTGGISPIGEIPLKSDPCYLSTDRTGRFLLSAYYRAGRVGVHRIRDDGAVAEEPVEWIATAEHAHCVHTDPSNHYCFVPHTVPSNAIFQFVFDQQTGRLRPNAVPQVRPERLDGPLHYCFHPSGRLVYVSNEQGSNVTAYRFDASRGTLSPLQTLSTLPEGYEGDNTCAQIHVAPSGRFLYVSNRGHDSIACFAIDAVTGELTALGQQPTEETPRVFSLDPEGRFLLAGGQGSGRLATYAIDPDTGKLRPLEVYTVGERPMWVHVEDWS